MHMNAFIIKHCICTPLSQNKGTGDMVNNIPCKVGAVGYCCLHVVLLCEYWPKDLL